MWQDTIIRVASTNRIFCQLKVPNWYGSSAPHLEGFRLRHPGCCCGPNSPRWLPWDLHLSSSQGQGKYGPRVTHTQTSQHRVGSVATLSFTGSWEFWAAICPVRNTEGFAVEASRNRDWRRMCTLYFTPIFLNILSSLCTLNLPNTTSFLIEEGLRRARTEVRKHRNA